VDTYQLQIGCVASTKLCSMDSRHLKENKVAAIGRTNNVTWASFSSDK